MNDTSASRHVQVCALMTCHNRRDLTVSAMEAIHAAADAAGVALRVMLTDDGSTDGTAVAISAKFPQVRILPGDGSLFWNRGMLHAWQQALGEATDFYLWLNDDLAVAATALADALAVQRELGGGKVICVGRTVDPVSGATTYGAFARSPGMSRLRFRHLACGETDGVTMNGNFVLIPAQAAREVGLLDPWFVHSAGDIDYGLRATRAGYRIVEIPHPVGVQAANAAYNAAATRTTWRNLKHTLTSPKAVPAREWLHFARRHGGPMWPVNFLYRYLKMLARGTFG